MDKTYFSIMKLKDIMEEKDELLTPTPPQKEIEKPTRSTKTKNNVTVPHNHKTTTPTPSCAAAKQVTVCQEMVPAGLSKFTSRDRKFTKIIINQNSNNKFSKFSKTKILRKWSETKLESGAKFTVQKCLEYSAPLVSTRPPKKQKIPLVNWPPKPPLPKRGVKSESKKRKITDSDKQDEPRAKKIPTKFNIIKKMFLNLESGEGIKKQEISISSSIKQD